MGLGAVNIAGDFTALAHRKSIYPARVGENQLRFTMLGQAVDTLEALGVYFVDVLTQAQVNVPFIRDGKDGYTQLGCRQREGCALLTRGKGPESGVLDKLREAGGLVLLIFFLRCGVSHRFYGVTRTGPAVACYCQGRQYLLAGQAGTSNYRGGNVGTRASIPEACSSKGSAGSHSL